MRGDVWLLLAPAIFLLSTVGEIQAQKSNLKMGSLYFDLSSYFNVEVNDNVNSSGVRPLDDVILRAGVSFDGNLELTSFNSFSLNFDLAYSKYLNNPELDSSNSFFGSVG